PPAAQPTERSSDEPMLAAEEGDPAQEERDAGKDRHDEPQETDDHEHRAADDSEPRHFAFLGTLAPFFRASDRPIAIACLRLVTRLPLLPLFSVPRLRRCIADFTAFPAPLLYLATVPSYRRLRSALPLQIRATYKPQSGMCKVAAGRCLLPDRSLW